VGERRSVRLDGFDLVAAPAVRADDAVDLLHDSCHALVVFVAFDARLDEVVERVIVTLTVFLGRAKT
jgi:hypothetical protein